MCSGTEKLTEYSARPFCKTRCLQSFGMYGMIKLFHCSINSGRSEGAAKCCKPRASTKRSPNELL